MRATKKALGWDPDKHFFVPDEVYAHMNGTDRGIELESEWRKLFERWSEAFPMLREQWDAAWDGRIGDVGRSPSSRPARRSRPATRASR